MKYLIHTCSKRKWYVDEFLVPSMKAQGIKDKSIVIYNDENKDGQLTSFIKSYNVIGDEDAWHLQDDIIISSKFKEETEKHDAGIICGFCNSYSKGYPGKNNVLNMWYSMPCIRIPGVVFKQFIDWLQSREVQTKYKHYILENKHDDVLFQQFLTDTYPRIVLLNLAPNLVNHIDHLIGGSLINKDRGRDTEYIMSRYWNEPELLQTVEESLKQNAKCG